MKVNIFNEDLLAKSTDVLSHQNNHFILSNNNSLNLSSGDNITIAKSIDNVVFYYDAEIKSINENEFHAYYKIFDSATNLRKHPREELDCPATTSFSNGSKIDISIIDVSKFGLKIKTNKEFPRIVSSLHCDNEEVSRLFGKNEKIKVVWRKNVGDSFFYGLQKIRT